jgi:hypothetical protein
MTDMDAPSPRRRFQFRLRTLLIGVTLLAIPCGYVGWQAKIVPGQEGDSGTHCGCREGVYRGLRSVRSYLGLRIRAPDLDALFAEAGWGCFR